MSTWVQLATVYEAGNQLMEARAWFERVSATAPQDAGVLLRLASLHSRMGDEEEALRYYKDAYSIGPVLLDFDSWLEAQQAAADEVI